MVQEGEEEQGYDEDLCAATNGSSAPSGLLIPPSNALDYLLPGCGGHLCGGPVYGGLHALAFIWAHVLHGGGGYPGQAKRAIRALRASSAGSHLGQAPPCRRCPSLSLIVVVIGGIIAGVFTATEGSAIAVVYALVLGICYRNITWKTFWNIRGGQRQDERHGRVPHRRVQHPGLGDGLHRRFPRPSAAALLGITDSPVHHPAHHERDPADRGHLYGRDARPS